MVENRTLKQAVAFRVRRLVRETCEFLIRVLEKIKQRASEA